MFTRFIRRYFSGKSNVGRYGEKKAKKYLKRLNYRVIEQNYVCKKGEIDLIAFDGNFIVFIEVKTRKLSNIHPIINVDRRKQVQLLKLSQYYLQQHSINNWQPRFDVVTVQIGNSTESIEHFKDAFSVYQLTNHRGEIYYGKS